MPKPIVNPHDKMFKTAMANHPIACDFFRQYLIRLYLYTAGNLKNANGYLEGCYEKISEPVRRTLMTIAEQLEAVGFEKGIQKGIEKGELAFLTKLLTKRFGPLPLEVEEVLAGASVAELEAWGVRIFEVETQAELLLVK